MLAAAVALGAPVFLAKPENLARLYPFLVSLASLSAFIVSSRDGGDILANFAERFGSFVLRVSKFTWTRRFATVDAEKREQLRASLPLWITGLSINTLILFLFLFWGSDTAWLSYAGFASYLLLFALGALTIGRVAAHARRRAQHAG